MYSLETSALFDINNDMDMTDWLNASQTAFPSQITELHNLRSEQQVNITLGTLNLAERSAMQCFFVVNMVCLVPIPNVSRNVPCLLLRTSISQPYTILHFVKRKELLVLLDLVRV